jgi:hypothetical protein
VARPPVDRSGRRNRVHRHDGRMDARAGSCHCQRRGQLLGLHQARQWRQERNPAVWAAIRLGASRGGAEAQQWRQERNSAALQPTPAALDPLAIRSGDWFPLEPASGRRGTFLPSRGTGTGGVAARGGSRAGRSGRRRADGQNGAAEFWQEFRDRSQRFVANTLGECALRGKEDQHPTSAAGFELQILGDQPRQESQGWVGPAGRLAGSPSPGPSGANSGRPGRATDADFTRQRWVAAESGRSPGLEGE